MIAGGLLMTIIEEKMNIKQINQVAENLKKIGVSIVLLIGGEPFVRKDISEIVRAFTSRNIHVRKQTNGAATREQLEDWTEEPITKKNWEIF